MSYLAKIKYSINIAMVATVMLLAGCATNQLSTNNKAGDAAATYGLQSNLAPNNLPTPVSIRAASFTPPPANALAAPSNLILLFGPDNNLNANDQQALQNQANYLVVHPNRVIKLDGYSDANGSPNVNVILSWQQLQKIKQQLLQYGVAPKQIEMVSYGKEMPLVEGYGNQAAQYNRRVQLVYEDTTS